MATSEFIRENEEALRRNRRHAYKFDPNMPEDDLVSSHLPLVKWFARKFYTENKDFVDLDDLVGAGNEALVIAARRFEPARGYQFSTYAHWWIQNRMLKLIRDNRWVMQIPERPYRNLPVLSRAASRLRRGLKRDPTVQELAEDMDWSMQYVRGLLLWSLPEVLSLDMPVGAKGLSTLGDFITDDHHLGRSNSHVERMQIKEMGKALDSALGKLSAQEQLVLRQRFGLDSDADEQRMGLSSAVERGEGLGLKQIGALFHLTDERIRQIECRALRKLRNPKIARTLEPFVRASLHDRAGEYKK
jgi:RNA polymerase primary sigma factor